MTLLSALEMTEAVSRWQKQNPKPASELDYVNPFTLLVAVVLSAQATDKGVNKATGPLFKIADTPEKMLALGEEGLISYIKTIGLYKNKAKHVLGLSKKLIDDYNSEVPATREELMTLPGVGRKTANVVLNVIFHQPTMPVDTHLLRAHRFKLRNPRTALYFFTTSLQREEEIWRLLQKECLLQRWAHLRTQADAQSGRCGRCFASSLFFCHSWSDCS